MTKSLIKELKNSVSWEVSDYFHNIFRGWSIDDVKKILSPTPNDN